MTSFYTVVGFGPEPFVRANVGARWNSGRMHSFDTLGQARNRQSRLRNLAAAGVEYKILETVIHADGSFSADWISE